MEKSEIKIGDIIQIDPDKAISGNNFFVGCFAMVTETKTWGVQGFVSMPKERGILPGEAYGRWNWEEFEIVGRAEWFPLSSGAEND